MILQKSFEYDDLVKYFLLSMLKTVVQLLNISVETDAFYFL